MAIAGDGVWPTREKEFTMKARSIGAVAFFALAIAMAVSGASVHAAGKSPARKQTVVRPANHVRALANHQHAGGASCGCESHATSSAIYVDEGASCGGSCGGSCESGCDSCDPCLFSLIFDDMCNAVDSMFSCKSCRSSGDECEVWDPCQESDACGCEDGGQCKSRRSPRRRPKCNSCGNCAGLWDDFCGDGCDNGCSDAWSGSGCSAGGCSAGGCSAGGCSSNTAGAYQGEVIDMQMAPPMELPDVPPPAPAGPNKAASRGRANRSVLRTPQPAVASPLTSVRRIKALKPKSPVLNPAKVNKTAAVESKPAAPSKEQNAPATVRPVAAEEPAPLAVVELAAPLLLKPNAPINPLRGSH
jgi:hypothetical protein